MTAPLHHYTVRFEHNHGFSEAMVRAESPSAALAKALEMDPCEGVFIDTFGVDTKRCDYISVCERGTVETLGWTSPEGRKRDQAEEMFGLLKIALCALNTAPRFRVPSLVTNSYDIAAKVHRLCAAIEGGGA